MREYPKLGELVQFVRADQVGQTHKGEGKVQAIFVGVDQRAMVQVREAKNAWNVEFAMINPSDEQAEAYAEAIFEVQRLTTEGNDAVAQTVKDFNAMVEAVYMPVLGDVVIDMSLPLLDAEEKEPELEAAA